MAPAKRPVFGQDYEPERKRLRQAMSRMLRRCVPPVPKSWAPVQESSFEEEPDDILKVAYLTRACGSHSEPPDTSRALPEDLCAAMSWAADRSATEIMEARETTMEVGMLDTCADTCCNFVCFSFRPSKRSARHWPKKAA